MQIARRSQGLLHVPPASSIRTAPGRRTTSTWTACVMSQIRDDKSEHCIPFILERLQEHRRRNASRSPQTPASPFFLGLNGVQGAGKTTLVSALSSTLSSPPHSLPTVVFSIDDLYLPHNDQQALAASLPHNPLVQHRGVPSTHDVKAGEVLFSALASRESNIKIPSYDKSQFNGAGDRRPESEWETVNVEGQPPVEVVIFEGWCVGFRALSDAGLERLWQQAKQNVEQQDGEYRGQLGKLKLDDVLFVNEKLRDYDALTDRLDAFIHIDAEDLQFVYDWRLQQEAALRASSGTGMTEEQVVTFVDGYYPAYELYTQTLRNGIFGDAKGKQMRLVVGKDRAVKQVEVL